MCQLREFLTKIICKLIMNYSSYHKFFLFVCDVLQQQQMLFLNGDGNSNLKFQLIPN
jgi:hypothetical protein